jgi:hypothetical protein
VRSDHISDLITLVEPNLSYLLYCPNASTPILPAASIQLPYTSRSAYPGKPQPAAFHPHQTRTRELIVMDLISTGSQYKLDPPQKRDWHTVSARKKLKVIEYFLHHRIEEPEVREGLKRKQRCLKGLEWDGWSRPPTSKEASEHFRIPERTIRDIWYKRHSVVQQSRSCRRDTSGVAGKRHPEPEPELFRQVDEEADGTERLSVLVSADGEASVPSTV